MPEAFIIVDPGMANALLSGRKTQIRLLRTSPLRDCAPGNRIYVREAAIACRTKNGGIHSTSASQADFMLFADGWRQFRDGSGDYKRRLATKGHSWLPAIHMPRWASRATLLVEVRRIEPLRMIGNHEVRAEGAVPVLGGLWWRWPRPIPGLYPSARAAFARYWSINHGTPGERWEDNPEVVVLTFRVEISGALGRIQPDSPSQNIETAFRCRPR
jgi:hypothetical protein